MRFQRKNGHISETVSDMD